MTRRVRFWRPRTLRAKLMAAMLGLTGLALALLALNNHTTRVALVNEANQKLFAAASNTAAKLDAFLRTNQEIAQALSGLPALHRFLELSPDSRQESQEELFALEALEVFSSYPYDQFNILSIALLDAAGDNVMDTIVLLQGTNEADTDYFQEAVRSGRCYTSSIMFTRTAGGVYLHFSCPVRASGTGPVLGVVRVRFSISTLQNLVFESSGLAGPQSRALLLDENMIRLADDDDPHLMFKTIAPIDTAEVEMLTAARRLPDIAPEELVISLPQFYRGLTGVDEETFFAAPTSAPDGAINQVAVVRLTRKPWLVVFQQPQHIFLAAIDEQSRGLLISGIILAGLSLAAVALLAHWMTEPITQLTATAREISAGNFGVQAEVTSNDEIGVLARAFNNMTDELGRTLQALENQLVELARMNDNLEAEIQERQRAESALYQAYALMESRVDERTSDLTTLNARLQEEIAERQQAEQKALQVSIERERIRLLSDFIRDASHEFRTPLSIINTKVHLLKQAVNGAKDLDHLRLIQDQSDTILRLLEALVTMSRLDSGVVFEFHALDLSGFVRQIYTRTQPRFAANAIRTRLELAEGLPAVKVAQDELYIAYANILDNAIRYTPAGGEITLRTYFHEMDAVAEIRDSGIGMEPEELNLIFERFYRVDKARSTRGFGLGLPIAARIVEAHGGRIECESKVDEGSTFRIRLPLHPPAGLNGAG